MYNFRRNNNRLVGVGAPFLLGALTGGVAVAAFDNYGPWQNKNSYPPYYGPGSYYGNSYYGYNPYIY